MRVSDAQSGGLHLAALGFLHSVVVGGAVVTFLVMSGAVSRSTTVWLGVAVVLSALALGLGSLALARLGERGSSPSDRA
jgi:hypothetical protein